MCVGSFKKQTEQIPGDCAQGNAEDDGNRDIDKIHQICMTALCHAEKGREQHNNENIVAGRPCQNELGNTFVCAIFCVHQLNHAWHNDCRRNCAEDSAHDSGLYSGNA